MSSQGRGSGWKQGDLLEPTVASSIVELPAVNLRVMVASHTCDLQDCTAEPTVAIAVGEVAGALDPNKRFAKEIRQLQLEATDGEISNYDIRAIRFIDANLLARHEPWPDKVYAQQEIRSLQRWLAQRYDRVAYPNDFMGALAAAKLIEKMRKRLKYSEDIVLDVRIALDQSLRPAGPYRLLMLLVYSTDKDPEGAKCNGIAEQIRQDFEEAAEKLSKSIELIGVTAQPDADITYKSIMRTTAWRLDELSLRSEAAEISPSPV